MEGGNGPQVRPSQPYTDELSGANLSSVRHVEPEEQHPHPFAPPELKQHFADFLKKFQSSPATSASASSSKAAAKKSGNGPVYEEFWQAPARYWKRELQDWEVDLVQVSLSCMQIAGKWSSDEVGGICVERRSFGALITLSVHATSDMDIALI